MSKNKNKEQKQKTYQIAPAFKDKFRPAVSIKGEVTSACT